MALVCVYLDYYALIVLVCPNFVCSQFSFYTSENIVQVLLLANCLTLKKQRMCFCLEVKTFELHTRKKCKLINKKRTISWHKGCVFSVFISFKFLCKFLARFCGYWLSWMGQKIGVFWVIFSKKRCKINTHEN